METPWLAAVAFLGLCLGLWLVLAGGGMRQRRGLGGGKTISLDKVTLSSRRLGLTGRPDRIYRTDGVLVIEEWKSSQRLQPWHRAQMGVYFLLAEDQLGVKPSHGFLLTGDEKRHRIDNSEELRAWVLAMAAEICQHRANVGQPIPVNPGYWQCRPCGQRGNCTQTKQ